MTLRFGTDGLRGVANAELTPELVMALGRAAAAVLGPRPFVVGRDTRISGPMLQAALTAGLSSEGVDVIDVGIAPTPLVAAEAARRSAAGAVISASHNPYADNGVKLFGRGGRKLSDHLEEQLERALTSEPGTAVRQGGAVGRVFFDAEAGDHYAEQVVATMEGRTLEGLRIVLDCAHGAGSAIGPDVFRRAGALVEVLNAAPDGTNINDGCGSTDPEGLARAVVQRGADLGLALDGDADRVVAVDDKGGLVDGDHTLAICAVDLQDRGRLRGDAVVVTVMTNIGFRLAMSERGIEVVETPVGDRYVLEALEEGGYSLGGEQSGHIIFRDLASTGDGLLTGVQLCDALRRSGRPLSALAAGAMTRLPQVLRNVRVTAREGVEASPAVQDALARARQQLGAQGRVVLRASGTEPVVRVMVEAATEDQARTTAEHLAEVVAGAAS